MNENETNEQWSKRPDEAPAVSPEAAAEPATPVQPEAATPPPPAMPTASPASGSGWRPPTEDSTLTSPAENRPPAGPSYPGAPSYPAGPSYPGTPSYPAAASQAAPGQPAYPTSGPAPYPTSGPAAYPTSAPTAQATGYEPTSSYPTYPQSGPYAQTFPTQPVPAHGERSPKRFGVLALASMLVLGTIAGGLVGGLVAKKVSDDHTQVRVVNGQVISNGPTLDRSSLASVAANVRPSVVSIQTSNAEGSGVVLSADGYVLTNNHVAVTANGQPVQITFDDGTTVKASLVGTDPKTDLAVFKVSTLPKKVVPAKFGDSSALQVGDTVLAIGSPLGLSGSVTEGIVSALNRTIDESADSQPQDPFGNGQQQQNQSPGATIAGAIQTDAAINPGNSGGALVNMAGEVVGINTAIATSSNGSDGNIGVGFAIPSNRAKEVADDLINKRKVSHPYLGIGVATADGNGGAVVKSVTAGSPAQTAGLQTGDVVTAYNGQAVHTSDDLINYVQADKVNNIAELTVLRNSASMQIKVTLGESK